MKFPTLQTSRLDLIEIRDEHLKDLLRLFGDEEVVRYYNLSPFKEPSEGQKFIDWYRSRFRDGLAVRWGIALKGENSIIGTIGYNNYTFNHRANIGYDLQRAYWGKGYITEALKEVSRYGFMELNINRIEAEVMQGNTASEKVLGKAGFTREGILREWMCWNNRHYDMTMFSLLKKNWFDSGWSSDRLILRSIRETDAEAIFAYRSLAEVARFQYWHPYTMEDALLFTKQYADKTPAPNGKWSGLAIIWKETGELIGDCALKINSTKAEIGCNLSPPYQKKGIAKEVLNFLIDYSFNQPGVQEVTGVTDKENLASVNLMRSLGLTFMEDSEEKVICKGEWCTEETYTIRKNKW